MYNRKVHANGRMAQAAFTAENDGELLMFLKEHMQKTPAGKVKSLLEHRCVSINGVVTSRYNAVVRKGQTVAVNITPPQYTVKEPAAKPLPILYEDGDILVINKPAGLLSIATDTEKEVTAYHIMTEYVKLSDEDNRLFIVHRLDRETSGVLLFAKNEEMKQLLQSRWDELVTCRGYVAVVEGKAENKSGHIESYLRETETHLVYSATRDNNGKLAITDYTVIKENEGCSMLRISISTGRKNQIRVHMKEMGNPVLGDKKYGSHSNPLKRLALHADRLEFMHPVTGEPTRFCAPVPRSFYSLF